MNKYIGLALEQSSNNTIVGNILSNDKENGLYLLKADNNTIVRNNITNNGGPVVTGAGIYTEASNNNLFCHNNLIDNALMQVYSLGSNNTWNCDYPSGGNYWSDYTGSDLDHDGIGDTPYPIDANNVDHYPLVSPWPSDHSRIYWYPTCPYPFASSSIPREREPVNVKVSIIVNQTIPDEIVLRYRANSGELWNTTMEYDDTCGSWSTTIPGQLGGSEITFYIQAYNAAGKITASLTYNWTVSDYKYAYADINGDGKIDMKDIRSVAILFGR